MATCPKCMGFLEEGHRCPRRAWWRVGHVLFTVLVGAALGTMLVYAFDDRPVAPLVFAAAALGAVLATAVRQTSPRI